MPTENEGEDEPNKHHQQKQADCRHGDQHRPTLVFIERKPLKPLRQQQNPLHRQQDDEQATRRGMKPAELRFRDGCLVGGHG